MIRLLADELLAFACRVLPWTALAVLLPLQAAIKEPVRVDGGMLSGAPGAHATVIAFKGVPYAAPPLGRLRWRAPQPPAPWQGVRRADRFGATCMQAPRPKGSFYQVEFYQVSEPVSEDCLYLNVWTAAESADERRPVMVWIHGGGFIEGSGSMPSFNGEALAQKGVVVVTINYRLGVFGFLAYPDLTKESTHHTSGNYAFLDQVAALGWVRGNIRAFGGDPDRVTIFGQSAGAMSVLALDASPLAKGLFQRAIVQSGVLMPVPALRDGEVAGAAFVKSTGAPSLAALRAKPAEDLLKAAAPPEGAHMSASFMPVVDGYFLPAQITGIFAEGKQSHVPFLLGSNSDEGSTLLPESTTAEGFRDLAKSRFGALADEFLKLYPASSDAEAWTSQVASSRDAFAAGMRQVARIQAKSGGKAYLYYFDRKPPGRASAHYGAYHSAELVYVFNELNTVDRPWTQPDRKLADIMSSYWANFARAGDPNGEGLPPWPTYDEKSDSSLELGDRIGPAALPDRTRLDLVEKDNFGLLL